MVRHYYHVRNEEARRQMARVPFLGEGTRRPDPAHSKEPGRSNEAGAAG